MTNKKHVLTYNQQNVEKCMRLLYFYLGFIKVEGHEARTGFKSRLSSSFGQIRPVTSELLSIEWRFFLNSDFACIRLSKRVKSIWLSG